MVPTGCSFFGTCACTLEAVFGVNITLEDEAGTPVTGATLTLTDGDHQETMTEVSAGNYAGALERAGTYALTIEAEGFSTFRLGELVVTADVCHVVPLTRTVVLPSDHAGLTGVMLAGPQCPVVGPGMGDECDDRPYMGTVIIKTPDGTAEITRFTADEDGTFQVPLLPGSYLLSPLPGPNGFPFAGEQTIEITDGTFTDVTILFDTGIR
jgi:hypothetical protein